MTLNHFDIDRVWPGLAPEDADQGGAAISLGIHPGKIVKPVGGAFIDRKMLRPVGFDHVAERCKGLPRQWGRKEFERFQD